MYIYNQRYSWRLRVPAVRKLSTVLALVLRHVGFLHRQGPGNEVKLVASVAKISHFARVRAWKIVYEKLEGLFILISW